MEYSRIEFFYIVIKKLSPKSVIVIIANLFCQNKIDTYCWSSPNYSYYPKDIVWYVIISTHIS